MQQTTKQRTCWLCNIPERRDLEQAYALGVSYQKLAQYLQQRRGYGIHDATHDKVRAHFRRNHQVEA